MSESCGIFKISQVRNVIQMYFQRLRDLREDRDLYQKDIAEVLGISQTVYPRYERGFQTIPVVHLLTLADFYHTSTDYILGRTNISNPYAFAQPSKSSR